MVKFSKDLDFEKVNKWNSYYINYKKLKKILNDSNLKFDNKNHIFDLFDTELTLELEKINKFYIENIHNLYNEKDNYNNKDISKFYIKIDELRHYVLLNIIGVIKIIKKRNKKSFMLDISDELNTLSLLKKQEFYNALKLVELIEDTNKIKMDIDKEYLENRFKKSESMLNNILYRNPTFEFDLLTDINTNKIWQSEDIRNYLYNKLGTINNLDVVVDTNTNSFERREYILNNITVPTYNKYILYKYANIFSIFVFLYGFLFGLDLMGSSFKALSGKKIGDLFTQIDNPIAGLIVGILATVLLQSSSTTTSIIVTMVGANVLSTKNAIPLVMGANIGTSITNTLISHGNLRDKNEFKNAFSGATIHDIFNLCTVLLLLPLEVITNSADYPILYNLSKWITNIFLDVNSVTFKSPLKIIVSPFVKKFISIDKNVIKGLTQGCLNCNVTDLSSCWDIKHKKCYTHQEWLNKYDKDIIKSGYFSDLGDITGGILCLIMSLVLLCICLYLIIRALQKLVLGGNKDGFVFKCLNSVIVKNGCCSMLFGMLLTIMVQSSSITTSVFTPLVGLSIISLEQMLPLTLGANIGTTCTALLASIVTESKNAVQIAICHLCFNIIGIVVLYPIPYIRKKILNSAIKLGQLAIEYKWFSVFYILYTFVLMPLVFLGVSNIFINTIITTIFGTLITLLLLIASFGLFYKFENIMNYITFS